MRGVGKNGCMEFQLADERPGPAGKRGGGGWLVDWEATGPSYAYCSKEKRLPGLGSKWRRKRKWGADVTTTHLNNLRVARLNVCWSRWDSDLSFPHLLSTREGEGIMGGQKVPPED